MSYSNEASIVVEEVENPDDRISWHEKISYQQVYNQAFIASPVSSEHRRDSPNSGTSETSLVRAPSQRTEEEGFSSQDSFNSSVVQTTGVKYCSGSNSEAEDPTGHKTDKIQDSASINILCMEKTCMSQECRYHGNKSSYLDESSVRYRKQSTRLDGADSFTRQINSSNYIRQVPVVPSSNYRLHMTPDSGILEVECLQLFREESMSSGNSAASGIANPKEMNWMSKGPLQATESISKTNARHNGPISLKESPVGNPNALLGNYPMQQSSKRPGCTNNNNGQSRKNHDLERAKTLQMQSMEMKEPLKPAEALDTRQDNPVHQIPDVPKLTQETSREQVHFSSKESGGTTTNILKSKKENIEGKKKNVFDWDSLRKQVQANGRTGERSKDTMDSLDYEAIRQAPVKDISDAIRERGMNNMLAERIKV